jgi:hypothetical protein
MINLSAVGALKRSTVFPTSLQIGHVSDLIVTSRGVRTFIQENLSALEQRQTQPELQRALRRVLSRSAMANAARYRLKRLTSRYPSIMKRLRRLQ